MSEIELCPPAPVAPSGPGERAHGYGGRVHLHEDPWVLGLLAKLSAEETRPPVLHMVLREVYRVLFARAAAHALGVAPARVPTRMQSKHPERGFLVGPLPDPSQEVVVVDVIRGGMLSAQVVYELLNLVLPPERVRLDHLILARRAGADGHVSGVDLSGSKVGGSVEGAILILPDPMGATGSTVVTVLEHYRREHGEPARVVLVPMVITPEYLRCVLALGESIEVHAGRLDRGLSPSDVLASPPGARWKEERGLDDQDYVVPGCGGMGEVLNNAWC